MDDVILRLEHASINSSIKENDAKKLRSSLAFLQAGQKRMVSPDVGYNAALQKICSIYIQEIEMKGIKS